MEILILCFIMILSFALGFLAVDLLVRFMEEKRRKDGRLSAKKLRFSSGRERSSVALENCLWYIENNEVQTGSQ